MRALFMHSFFCVLPVEVILQSKSYESCASIFIIDYVSSFFFGLSNEKKSERSHKNLGNTS